MLGEGVWIDRGKVVGPIRRAIVLGGPLQMLNTLAAAAVRKGSLSEEGAESGPLLIPATVLPA